MIRIKFVQVPEQKTLFLCARCGISKCNLNSSKLRSPGSFKLFIVFVILDEQNKK